MSFVRNGFLLACTMMASAVQAELPHFSSLASPSLSGQRAATALVDFKGVPDARMTVFVVYGDSREAVANAFQPRTRTGREPSGNASCAPAQGGGHVCSFIFPHAAHPKPNVRDDNPRVFPAGATVFYAWGKTFTPAGATSALTLNSDVQQFAMPRRATIALLGDSYAAGEGAPNRPLTRTAATLNGARDDGAGMWDDVLCHRSKKGGLELGVQRLISELKELDVDYVNVTCSGAETGQGLMSTFPIDDDAFPPSPMDPGNRKPGGTKAGQIRQVLDWLDAKRYPAVDAVVMSIGGNDVGFGPTLGACLAAIVGGDCGTHVRDVGLQALAIIPGSYDELNTHFLADFQARGKALGQIFITEYPDPTNDARGEPCGAGLAHGANPFSCWGPLEAGLSTSDFVVLEQVYLGGLNKAVADAARAHGWTYVGGIADASKKHGLCDCSGGYFNTIGQSDHTQGDLYGSIHPNASGYANAYAPAVFHELSRYFRLTRPREELKLKIAPASITAASASKPSPARAFFGEKKKTPGPRAAAVQK